MSLGLALALLAATPVQPASPQAGPGSAPSIGSRGPVPETPSALADSWGPTSATATAERTEVHLGEPFTVTVEVRHAKGEVWTLQPGAKLDPFVLRSVTSAVQPSGDLETTKLSVELALFELGPHAVPDLDLVAATPSAKPAQPPHTFSLPGPEVKGIASASKDTKKRDIRGPVPFKVTSFRVLLYLLGAAAILGLAAWGLWMWRKRPRREPVALTPQVPEDQIALAALAALEVQGLPGNGRFKEFHLALSEILRRYLTDRYGILALDMTSEEIYQTLARLPTEGLSLNDFAWVCAQGDLAKFAKAAPTVDDCRQALQLVRQLVLRTRRAITITSPATQPAERAA
jgi:hypothetical protein